MKRKFFFIAVSVISGLILFKMIYDYKKYDNFVCQTKKLELNEVITYVSGRSDDIRIQTNKHKKPFSINIWKEVFNSGFPADYIEIKEGDSIIKKAGSNEFVIKRGKKKAAYILNCDD